MTKESTVVNSNYMSEVESLDYAVQDSFPFARDERPLLVANCSKYVVAHSTAHLQPARQISEVSFLPHILNTMRRLRLTELLRLQSYAWPYLRLGEGHGAVLVSAPRSGRTLSYVPPLCHVVCRTLTELRCQPRWKLCGPIALVLVADLRRVQQIGSLCNAMLRKANNEQWLTLVLTVPSARTPEFFQRLLNGVGCLVATPAQLLWCLSNELISFPYLRFLVYDDVDLMPPEQFSQVHQQLLMLTRKPRPQMVLISESYNKQLLHMLCEFNAHPLVLFGDILEAALYGGARIRLLLSKRQAKRNEVLLVLQQRPPELLRTVIFCQTDAEISELVQRLDEHGYSCLPYYKTADWGVREEVHRWIQDSRGELLLCTDDCPELDIRHAHTLIHYSMSDSWSKFKLRHLALSNNLCNQFFSIKPKEEESENHSPGQDLQKGTLLSLVLLDESNSKQLPRLVDFLQIHQQVDERVVLLARLIRDQLARAKCNEPALCDLLLSLGHCGNTQCEQRHQLLPEDRKVPAHMPANGDVKLQLVRTYSPAHYCVRLLEYLPPGGRWQPVPNNKTLEMQLQLLQSQQCVRHWPPKAKEICVFRNAIGYERVRILRVAPIKQVNLSCTDIAVEVQALDVDTRQFKTTSGKLYICPEQLRDAPPLAVDLRILGMIPYTGERNWHEEDGRLCAGWLNDAPQPNFLQASIVLSLSHTIFVHDLAVSSYAPSLKLHVRRFTMRQQLQRQQLAKESKQAIEKLMKFLKENNSQPQEKPLQEPKHVEPKSVQTLSQAAVNFVSKRYSFFAKMAFQMGRENRQRLEQEQQQEQQQESPQEQHQERTQEQHQKQPQKLEQEKHQFQEEPSKEIQHIKEPEPGDCIKAFFNCLINCSLQPLTEEDQVILLSQILKPEIEPHEEVSQPEPAQYKRENRTAASSILEKTSDLQYQIPPHVIRPEVIYYQTLCTLELQIILPEEQLQYEAVLHNDCCIAFWTLKATTDCFRYQFIVNTQCPYQKLNHRMQGRTVYLSIVKALAVPYPLQFSFYKFMKAHHEKLNLLEEKRRLHVENFESSLLRKGYILGLTMNRAYLEDEQSSDDQAENLADDLCGERVERARDGAEFLCD